MSTALSKSHSRPTSPPSLYRMRFELWASTKSFPKQIMSALLKILKINQLSVWKVVMNTFDVCSDVCKPIISAALAIWISTALCTRSVQLSPSHHKIWSETSHAKALLYSLPLISWYPFSSSGLALSSRAGTKETQPYVCTLCSDTGYLCRYNHVSRIPQTGCEWGHIPFCSGTTFTNSSAPQSCTLIPYFRSTKLLLIVSLSNPTTLMTLPGVSQVVKHQTSVHHATLNKDTCLCLFALHIFHHLSSAPLTTRQNGSTLSYAIESVFFFHLCRQTLMSLFCLWFRDWWPNQSSNVQSSLSTESRSKSNHSLLMIVCLCTRVITSKMATPWTWEKCTDSAERLVLETHLRSCYVCMWSFDLYSHSKKLDHLGQMASDDIATNNVHFGLQFHNFRSSIRDDTKISKFYERNVCLLLLYTPIPKPAVWTAYAHLLPVTLSKQ